MKKIFLLAAAALVLTSCENNDDNTVPAGDYARITATIGESVSSRANDTIWSPGDMIGISSTVGTVVGPYINLQYTTAAGNGEFKGTPLYFFKPMTLTAYYPFTGSEGTASGIIEANTDADNQKPGKQQQIDFLWASLTNQDLKDFSASNPYVNFIFAHKMSKLTFAFKGSKEVVENGIVIAPEVKVSDMVSYEIEGLVLDGTFDTATGICEIDNNAAPQNLSMEFRKGDVEEQKSLPSLIVFPQKQGNTNVKLHVYTDELDNTDVKQHYVCTLTFGDGQLKPGNSYRYTVQISKVGLIIEKMTIVDWNNERDVNLTATVDGGWQING